MQKALGCKAGSYGESGKANGVSVPIEFSREIDPSTDHIRVNLLDAPAPVPMKNIAPVLGSDRECIVKSRERW